jgi:septum formation protein
MDQRHDFPSDFQLVLASQSPRRHSLLREMGIPFTPSVSEATELASGMRATHLVEANALAKVRGASLPLGVRQGAFVLGTDTLVSVGRRVMGKPVSAEEAAEMLAVLSGRTHRVVSGVALVRKEAVKVASCVTHVTFSDLDKTQIDAYLASGEWRGKAGAYAIQGLAGLLVRGMRGEYSNVVGLPLHVVYRLFRELGFDLLRREWLAGGRTG